MKKYMIGLGLILGTAYYIFDMNQQKNMKVEMKTHDGLKKIDKTVSSVKNKEYPNNQTNNVQLEQIMSTKVEEPAATEMWNWLMKNGFEHPKSIERLDYLCLINGVRKYYKELIAILKYENLSIDARSAIVRNITVSFDGGFGTQKPLSQPANEKDIAIQGLIREELNYPKDKKSFFEALQATGFLAENNEIQEVLNGLLEKDNPYIDKNDVYIQKVRLVAFSEEFDSAYTILNQVISLDEKDRKIVMKEVAQEDYAYVVLRSEDENFKNSYIKTLEDNLPKAPQSFDENNFDKHFEEEFTFPDKLVTDEQKQNYAEKNMQRLYKEARDKVSGNDRGYKEWIQAYALMVDKNDRYEFYKNKILDAETSAEKEVIQRVMYERSEYEEEYKVYTDMLEKDKEIIKEESSTH